MSANINPPPPPAGTPPGPMAPATPPPRMPHQLSDYEAFQLVRDGIKHEDELTHQRLTWLLTAEAFFLTAFGVLAGILVTKDHSWMETLAGFLVLILFSGAAIWLCLIVRYSVDAADAQLHVLKNWWYTRLLPGFNEYRQPTSPGKPPGTKAGSQPQERLRQRNRVFAPWIPYERRHPVDHDFTIPDECQNEYHAVLRSYPPVMGWFRWKPGLGVGSVSIVFLTLNWVLFGIASVGAVFWLSLSLEYWTPSDSLKARLRAPDKEPSTVRVAPATNNAALSLNPVTVQVSGFPALPVSLTVPSQGAPAGMNQTQGTPAPLFTVVVTNYVVITNVW